MAKRAWLVKCFEGDPFEIFFDEPSKHWFEVKEIIYFEVLP